MKTKPIGVRFDTELIELMELKHGIKTPQKILNYLSNKWLAEDCVEIPPTDQAEIYANFKIKPAQVLDASRYSTTKTDYQSEFNKCEFPEEYKALWEKIKYDAGINEKDKALWKLRLNAK